MKSEATDFHPNIVEEFRTSNWYDPRVCVGHDRPISALLLSVYGGVLFAAITIALANIGGNTFLMSVYAAVLLAAITIALVGIAVGD